MTSNVGMPGRYGRPAVSYEGSKPVDSASCPQAPDEMARRVLTYVMLAVVTPP
jgi:hypothetical protein